MKFTHATLLTSLGVLQSASAAAVSWELSTWSDWGATGDFTGAYIMPETPSIGTCPVTDTVCVSFENSHSVSAAHLSDDDYTTLYIHAWTGTDCSGDWTAYSVTDTAVFDIDTGGPVKSLSLMVGLCGPPW